MRPITSVQAPDEGTAERHDALREGRDVNGGEGPDQRGMPEVRRGTPSVSDAAPSRVSFTPQMAPPTLRRR